MFMMTSQILKFADSWKTQKWNTIFSSSKKIHELHFKGNIMAKNRVFFAEAAFKADFVKLSSFWLKTIY